MFTLYSYAGRDAKDFRKNWEKIIRDEFYQGELLLASPDHFDLKVEKALSAPISLMHVTTGCGLTYRRAWNHIRQNQSGVRIFFFVRNGSFQIIRSHVSLRMSAGEWCIINSGEPFVAHSEPGSDGKFEVSQAIVPPSFFYSHIITERDWNTPFPMHIEGQSVIPRYLDLMIEQGEHLSRRAAESLASSFLHCIADYLGQYHSRRDAPRRPADQWFGLINDIVDKNFTDPELDSRQVAARCGISSRYLCLVLKSNNTSFSASLWTRRLGQAREWLLADTLSERSVSQIGFMAGFKSASHFSRLFRETFGCSPTEYRAINRPHNDD